MTEKIVDYNSLPRDYTYQKVGETTKLQGKYDQRTYEVLKTDLPSNKLAGCAKFITVFILTGFGGLFGIGTLISQRFANFLGDLLHEMLTGNMPVRYYVPLDSANETIQFTLKTLGIGQTFTPAEQTVIEPEIRVKEDDVIQDPISTTQEVHVEENVSIQHPTPAENHEITITEETRQTTLIKEESPTLKFSTAQREKAYGLPFHEGPRMPGEPKVEYLIRTQEEHLKEYFEIWAYDKRWDMFHTSHYDWWMFPIPRPSVQKGELFAVSLKEIEELRSNPESMKNYRRGVELVLLSWGWDVNTGEMVPSGNRGARQSWEGYGVRLGKMADFLFRFGEEELYEQVVKFYNQVKGIYPLEVWVKECCARRLNSLCDSILTDKSRFEKIKEKIMRRQQAEENQEAKRLNELLKFLSNPAYELNEKNYDFGIEDVFGVLNLDPIRDKTFLQSLNKKYKDAILYIKEDDARDSIIDKQCAFDRDKSSRLANNNIAKLLYQYRKTPMAPQIQEMARTILLYVLS